MLYIMCDDLTREFYKFHQIPTTDFSIEPRKKNKEFHIWSKHTI